ncbi:MAG: family 1 glycosylhydrolase [Spirochaetales bacterium]
MPFKLKENLLLGTATAATQIEGGDTNNSWYDWSLESTHIADGTNSLRAVDHYNRVKSDTDIMAKMGMQIYRLGIEWSRIEPQRGQFDDNAIAHYRNETELLIKNGIKPLITLHHFTNPRWFEEMGAFENPESPAIFLDFVRYTVEKLADLVPEWVTVNEPNVYAVNGYIFGTWPPGKKNSLKRLQSVYTNLCACHIGAYKEIHRIRRKKGFSAHETRVGFANHVRVFKPKCMWNPLHVITAAFMKKAFQETLTHAMMTGKTSWPVKKLPAKIGDIDISGGRYYDFIGINYYTRDAVVTGKYIVFAKTPINDLSWEIYPQGIVELSRRLYAKYSAPIYITENGTCDNADVFRSRYIYEHLKVLCESDLPVERYYHWSFTDNFEWAEGETPRFGLVHVDYETQKRTVKKSGEFYSAVIKEGGVSQELYDAYVKDCVYRYNV